MSLKRDQERAQERPIKRAQKSKTSRERERAQERKLRRVGSRTRVQEVGAMPFRGLLICLL